MAAAPKKSDPTVPIIVVLAALLLLILFGGNCNGIPRVDFNTGSNSAQNTSAPRSNQNRGGNPGDHRGPPGERRGPGPARRLHGEGGCAESGRHGCRLREDRGRHRVDDCRRHHRACGPGRDRADDRTERRRTHGD